LDRSHRDEKDDNAKVAGRPSNRHAKRHIAQLLPAHIRNKSEQSGTMAEEKVKPPLYKTSKD
jgi:hypothetical protein